MTEIGGYDVEFVGEPPFETSCSICLLTLKEPVQVDSCGHRFCKGCIEMLRQRNDGQIYCPNDQLIIQSWFRDNAVERDILNLNIKCTMHNGGCVWKGELRNLENHLEICDFFEIPCVNENCRENMERRKLIIHLQVCQYRIVECNFCSEEYCFNDKKKHCGECIKYPLNCPNQCVATISRDLMEVHIEKKCPNTMHTCKYIKIGCQIKGTRSELDQHLEDETNKHLSQAVERIDQQNEHLSQAVERIDQQNEQIEFLFQKMKSIFNVKSLDFPVKPFTFPINNFHQKFESAKKINKSIYSDPFYCLDGYRARLRVYLNGFGAGRTTHVSLYFEIMKGPFDDMLDWPFNGIATLSVPGKGKEGIKKKIYTTKVPQNIIDKSFLKPYTENNIGQGRQYFIKHDVIEDYKTDDTLIIICQVKPV